MRELVRAKCGNAGLRRSDDRPLVVSAHGPSLPFAVEMQSGRFRGEADMRRAALTEPNL
jgi:hypothetical protein